MSRWFDTHLHLDRYTSPERDAVLARAEEAGVGMLTVGVDLASSLAGVELAARCPGVVGAAVGLHPTHGNSEAVRDLHQLASRHETVAIGECGFDDAGPDWDIQLAVLEVQCELARRLRKPIILHIDGPEAWTCLANHGALLDGLAVVRHYFTGDAAQAAWHAERGHYLSFGNPLRREPALRDIAREYPEHLLVIETDSYPMAGRYTEPAHVARIGETLAVTRGWTFDQAREQLAANTVAAFKLPAATYLSQGFATP